MRKLLLSLTPSEPLALMKELSYFDDSIVLDVLLIGSLHFDVCDLINFNILNVVRVELCRVQVLNHLQGVQERWKIWSKHIYIKYRVQAKEMRNT